MNKKLVILTARTTIRGTLRSRCPQVTHKEPEGAVDHVAFRGVQALRFTFDLLAGFKTGVIDEAKCEQGNWVRCFVRAPARGARTSGDRVVTDSHGLRVLVLRIPVCASSLLLGLRYLDVLFDFRTTLAIVEYD